MQTEASTLPKVQLDVHRTANRKLKPDLNNSTLEPKKLSSGGNTLLPSSRKCLNPLLGAPYRSSIKQQSMLGEPKSNNKTILGQRVMSAKVLRFKQLQNQLADAHYHLNELANENRLLKALQKRQDSALRRYEGTNAELPRLINSHHEELRVLQTKYKKLKELHKNTCNLLKEKETELHTANSQNKHLLQLSKDRNLEEREKLQLQLSDMNHKMQQQHETIQLLHRKLALETKSLKHQLHIEVSKHKETQKSLQDRIEKLKSLECLLDNREKRLYYNGQLPIFKKEKSLGSHSLTSLRDVSISNPVKVSGRGRKSENGIPKDNLPSLDILESNDDEKVTQATNHVKLNHSVDQLKSETMTSLQQIRKFRLQRSPQIRKNAYSMDDLRYRAKDLETETYDTEKISSSDYKAMLERDDLSNDKSESGKLRKLFNRMKSQKSQKLEKELKVKFDYSSDDGESGNVSERPIESYTRNTAQKSRELYARLINSTDDTSDTLDDMMKRVEIRYSDEEDEKDLNTRLANDLVFQRQKYKSKLEVLRHHRNKDLYDSDSEVDSEEKIYTTEGSSAEYKANNFQTGSSKYTEEQFNKSFDDIASGYTALESKEESVIGRFKEAQLQRISSNALDDNDTENIEAPQQSSNIKKVWLEKQQLLENNEIDHSSVDIKKKDYTEDEETKYSEDKLINDETSHRKINHNTNNVHEEMKSLPSPEMKEVDKSSQQTYGMEFMMNHSDKSSQPVHNLGREQFAPKIEEMPIQHDGEETSNENDFNIETKNKLNASLETDHPTEQNNGAKTEIIDTKPKTNNKKKIINYNKEKLLATMKAIDDNDNIEFLNQGFKNHNVMNRMQITENLYRGIPTHSKSKRDIIKDIFEDNHIENKTRSTCSKSH